MDKTAVFRAYVKTIKTRNRAFGSAAAAVHPADALLGKQRKPPRDDFSRRAKDVVNDLGKLTDFLDRHYKDYIDVQSFDQHTAMTDADRDKIDAGAQHIVKTAGQQVGGLRGPPSPENPRVDRSLSLRETEQSPQRLPPKRRKFLAVNFRRLS